MFHLMMGIFPLIFLVVLGSILLFGIVAVLAGLIGGTSAALLVKSKTARNLILTGFGIVLFAGVFCLLPFINVFEGVSLDVTPAMNVILVLIAALAIFGIRLSRAVKNNIVRTVLTVLFVLVCVIVAALFALQIYLILKVAAQGSLPAPQ